MKKASDTAENSSGSSKYYVESEQENSQEKSPVEADTPQSEIPYTENQTESATVSENSTDTSGPTAKYFVYPVGGEIIKGFSNSKLQYSVTYNDMRLHTAVDIAADAKTAVNASGDGTVIFAEKDPSLGYTVKIDHGNGIVVVYGGLGESLKVKEGDLVSAGTNLGSVGVVTEESLDAPHLHLEFLQDGKPIDPISMLTEN